MELFLCLYLLYPSQGTYFQRSAIYLAGYLIFAPQYGKHESVTVTKCCCRE